jgi:hypothetical protein
MADQFDSVNQAFDTADKNLDDIQKSIDKYDDELMRLNADLINHKGNRHRDVLRQIKNVEQALKRKQAQYTKATRVAKQATKIGRPPTVTATDITKGLESVSGIVMGVTGAGAMVSQGKGIIDEFGQVIPKTKMVTDQQLPEVTVTAHKKDNFFSKYKFYLIGAVALVLILMFKKK